MRHFFQRTQRSKRKNGGYILLLTLLVISILLAVSTGISGISIREIVLSSFLRDSAKAFSAADRGAECALFWDRSVPQNGMPYTIFATGTVGILYDYSSNLSAAVCNNGQANMQLSASNWVVTSDATSGTTKFSLNFSDGTCVDVTVIKVGLESTTIIGDGYNTCTLELPRRTQREIVVFTNI
ncbi:MAG: hypothetical protein A2942_02225 [Candidatus Lloydbacteria bacterium RIFCSPLOWO2_01_FULL_50_20]|uniref:Type 4 fimbrial biogenesis protein PilX N-terminal domain-containing protein n=1 Tax=Candidatus Lloydbacteria bacterium RIFCSPLOWO2_01_FULL_50_20 TaxID=1798665 RepID=A0A1G2DEI2_9BACT|nr:MAG: hypothetical protein A2942_02225 [Candidatus Lloydbacteria bacterium RIFCSPLOWO2_01_FULL_50_20]